MTRMMVRVVTRVMVIVMARVMVINFKKSVCKKYEGDIYNKRFVFILMSKREGGIIINADDETQRLKPTFVF